MKLKGKYILGIAFIAVVYAFFSMKEKETQPTVEPVTDETVVSEVATAEPTGTAEIGGDFTLTDTTGKTVTNKDFAGKYTLVYFGFTNCPEACITSLQTISETMQKAGEKAANVQPLFITVDPKRDTGAVIAEYLKPYDSRILGLTGTEEQVSQAVSAYKVAVPTAAATTPAAETTATTTTEAAATTAAPATEAAPATTDALVNHSSFIYLMGKDGKFIKHFSTETKPDEILAELNKLS